MVDLCHVEGFHQDIVSCRKSRAQAEPAPDVNQLVFPIRARIILRLNQKKYVIGMSAMKATMVMTLRYLPKAIIAPVMISSIDEANNATRDVLMGILAPYRNIG